MREQGCSTLPVGDDGRILDRLAGLEKIISPEVVRQVLAETGRVNGRSCPLTHEVMLWIVCAMGLLTNLSIRLRHRRTKGNGTRRARLAMMFKLAQSAERRWRLLDGAKLLPDVIRGVIFKDGIRLDQAAA
jgi:hypothetical protein